MKDLIEPIVGFVQDHWPSRAAAAVVSMVLLGLVLAMASKVDLTAIPWQGWVAAAVAALLPWVIWYFSVRISKHTKGSVGFGVAIAYDSPQQAARLRSDFVERVETLLVNREASHPFDFIEFPQHIAQEVRTRHDAEDLIRKARGHYLIFGTAKSRIVGGEKQHVLELEGLVRHSVAPDKVQHQLSREFREVLPRSLLIAEENDLFSLRLTAAWIDVGARYIVGIAALISGDLTYAEDLFTSLERELGRAGTSEIPAISVIRNRLPSRLAEVYKEQVNRLGTIYQMKRDTEYLIEAEGVLDKLEQYDDAYYSGHLHRAICHFVLRRDIEAARAALRKCESVPDGTWRYSVAFLDAYEGDLAAAYEQYKRAFRQTVEDDSVPVQSEEFIHEVLSQEPEQGQLFYCLGLINHRIKGDLAAARRDFQQFLAQTGSDEYPKEHQLVRRWIQKIDRKLNALLVDTG